MLVSVIFAVIDAIPMPKGSGLSKGIDCADNEPERMAQAPDRCGEGLETTQQVRVLVHVATTHMLSIAVE